MAIMLVHISAACFIVASAATIPTVKVLQGPGSKTTVYGPDGSTLQSVFPGGTLTTAAENPGLVAAGPANLPSSHEVVVGGGVAGKIVTAYTLAGPALVPAVPVGAIGSSVLADSLLAGVSAPLEHFEIGEGLHDDGSYRPGKYE
ncbi:uncharacterized protein LOC109540635 [Dendroctonus ponderosae]|uniref:DUF4774 domain-containing protein n=1 Tax=Dendroctonus ponderosae TaxID=77166 RepID=U4TXK2_DENPD|nr:uncharacterized protein LOC109540635 [Dendroctonus ponderosae]ERL85532.1 hypothetical protein D910_02951 [Dendroctonus ponderosae]KAH1014955.1 hypothetical protein HUJ05_012750 [Dendroctonus ponderosae]